MLKLMGGNPLLGLVLAAALLVAGLPTHRPLLTIAGAFVGITSLVRVTAGRGRGHGGSTGRRR